MNFNVNELLNSLSFTLDCVEGGLLKNVTNHGRRVAYISARIGMMMKFTGHDLFDLISYALLHDNGVTKSLLHASNMNEFYQAELNRMHCIEGESNIEAFPFFHRVPDVILYHHERYDGSGFFGVSRDDIPLYSRIIGLADFIAVIYSEQKTYTEILESLKKSSRLFDPTLLAAVYELGHNAEFWLNMNDMFVFGALNKVMPSVVRNFSYREMRSVSQIFSNIIDAKSPFTGSHSRGISAKTGVLCRYYEYDEDTYWKMRIAADLHDLGKLMVPNQILDKPGSLTPTEILIVQSHPFYTRRALEVISGFEKIADWAGNHHEKLNGKGYPYGLDASFLDFNSRILGCIDIYQALTEDRPYRQGLSHGQTITLMRGMVNRGLIEGSIVEDINSVFGESVQLKDFTG